MGATVLGRHLFALGGNEMAARLSGLPTRRLKAVAYGLSGMLAALGGMLFTGRSGQADPRSASPTSSTQSPPRWSAGAASPAASARSAAPSSACS